MNTKKETKEKGFSLDFIEFQRIDFIRQNSWNIFLSISWRIEDFSTIFSNKIVLTILGKRTCFSNKIRKFVNGFSPQFD